MRNLFILILLFACSASISAQEKNRDWVEMISEPNANVFEVETAFNEYWGDRKYQKGKSFKQFYRWKKLVMPYTDAKGYIHRSHEVQEILKYQKAHPAKKQLAAWTHLGPVLPTEIGIGRLNSISFHPNNAGVMFGGSSSGGLWRSRDNGNSWNPTTDDLPSLGVSDLAIDPTDSDIMYMATGDGDGNGATSPSFGIVKTINGGVDWEVILPTTGDGQFINELLINPDNTNIIMAATSFGLYRTEDAGENWEQVYTGTIEDILFKPGDTNTVYACGNGGVGFLRSVDGGVIWTHVFEGLPTGGLGRKMIAVTPANPDYVYIVVSRNRNQFEPELSYLFRGLYRSTNGGLSFELRGSEGADIFSGQSWYDLALNVSPTNPNQVFLGETELLRSNNGGVSWQNINFSGGDWVHVDIHDIEFHPETQELYVASDGGLYRSTNSGNSFQRISDGLGITEYYRMGGSTTNPNLILAGSQDNGTMIYDGNEWRDFAGGDGMECIVDYTNENWRTYSFQNGVIRRSVNGQDANFINPSITGESGNWTTPYIQHPTKPDIFYAGFQSVWKTTNRGNAWTNISGELTSGSTLEFIAAAPSDGDNYIYVSDGNRLFITKDGGENWKTIGTGSRGFLSSLAIHPSKPETLWAAQGRGVYLSEDAGDTWVDVSGTLPEIPALTVAYQGGNEETMYVGMTVGVYYKDNTMEDWEPLMDNFPNVRVTELELLPCDGKLRAATYGRGLWETEMINYNDVAFEVETIIQDIACQSGSNGSVELVLSGGVPPYSIVWEDGKTVDKLEFLDGGTYRALVTDATFCRRTVEAVISSALGIADIEVTPASCSNSADGSIEIDITGGTGNVYFDWGNGVTTPSLQNASAGTYVLVITDDLGCIDAELIDIPASIAGSYFYPINEDFNQGFDEELVNIENPQDDGLQWTHRLGLAGHSGAMWIENDLSGSFNTRDNMVMEFDLTTTVDAILNFDVASTGKSNNQFNRLIVEVQGCGSNQSITVYDEDREDLNTVPNQTGAFTPTANQWRTETIDLSIFEGQKVLVRFVNVHRRGNNMYIDNISVDGITDINPLEEFGFDAQVVPNPHYGNFAVSVEAVKSLTADLEIYNTLGQVLESKTINLTSGKNQVEFEIEDAPSGIYFLKFKAEGNELIRKMVKY